jgi:hypothetical protein
MFVMVSGPVPLLVTMSPRGALVEPTAWLAKGSGLAEKVMPAVPLVLVDTPIFATKTPKLPFNDLWNAPVVVGKFVDAVSPPI